MLRRFSTWLAIFGMVLNALWPLLANAGPTAFSAPICSMVGTTAASGVAGMPMQPAPSKLKAPHCPFCPGIGEQTPALASCSGIAVMASVAAVQPISQESSPPVSFLHLAAPPRGPPVLLI